MTDESNTGPVAAVVGVDTEVKTPAAKKQRSPRRQKVAPEPVQPVSKAAAKSPTAKPSRSSEHERAEKLKLIEKQVAGGISTLKAAIKSAGISAQTYYVWKRVAKPAKLVKRGNDKPVSTVDALADLVQLEAENQRLRKILAEKLRTENAELRKKLGLD